MTDLSVIVPLRDREDEVAATIRSAARVVDLVRDARSEAGDDLPPRDLTTIAFEILALDERSGDNTLSVLGVLQGQISGLRIMQDVAVGTSIRRASSIARGDVWLVIDHGVDLGLACWAVLQVLGGQRAAWVPGELLAVTRELGQRLLRRHHGGLVSAQNAVVRSLRARGERAAFSPSPKDGALHRARLLLRGSLGRLGLGRFDRP